MPRAPARERPIKGRPERYPPRGPSGALRGRRGDILDAALELFTSHGYAHTPMEDIASEARASIGSIYHHFGGKEQLAAALYVSGLADYHRGLIGELERGHQAPEQAVMGLVRAHLRWVEENRPLARFILTMREPDVIGAADRELRHMNRQIFDTIWRWIDRWVEEGSVRRLPFGLFYAIVLGPSQEFARHWLAGRVEDPLEDAAGILADAAWRAVRA